MGGPGGFTYREIIRRLKLFGFSFYRQAAGSYEIWYSWGVLGPYGLEGVRQVAIDEDWTAMRFGKVDYIKTMTRKFGALSEGGKAKTGQTAG